MHSKITKKGQTTIPAPIRKALHLEPGDTIAYEVRESEVVIKAQPSLSDLKGILAPYAHRGKGISWPEQREIARQAWAEEAAKEGLE